MSFYFFSLQPRIEILAATFFVTMSIYTLNKLTDKEEDEINMPERKKVAESGLIVPVSLSSYVAALALGGMEKIEFVVILLVPLLAGFIYSIKIGGFRVKDIFLMKNTVIAFSCTTVAMIPFFYISSEYNKLIFIYSFFFLKLFINTVIFDVRDVYGDKTLNINTIPVKIGVNSTKKLLHSLNIAILAIIFAGVYMNIFTKYLPVLLFSVVYAYLYIRFSDRISYKLLYDLLVDGEWIYLALMIYIINIF